MRSGRRVSGGSYAWAIADSVADDGHSGGPVNTFEIKGDNHEIDIHLHSDGLQ
jgi:hypothetical protein